MLLSCLAAALIFQAKLSVEFVGVEVLDTKAERSWDLSGKVVPYGKDARTRSITQGLFLEVSLRVDGTDEEPSVAAQFDGLPLVRATSARARKASGQPAQWRFRFPVPKVRQHHTEVQLGWSIGPWQKVGEAKFFRGEVTSHSGEEFLSEIEQVNDTQVSVGVRPLARFERSDVRVAYRHSTGEPRIANVFGLERGYQPSTYVFLTKLDDISSLELQARELHWKRLGKVALVPVEGT